MTRITPKAGNIMVDFMKAVTTHWQTIAQDLRAQCLNPLAALEAEKSRLLGMHHDVDLAAAFIAAKQTAETAQMQAKHARKRIRIGAGFL